MWIASWITIGTGRCPLILSHGTDRIRDAGMYSPMKLQTLARAAAPSGGAGGSATSPFRAACHRRCRRSWSAWRAQAYTRTCWLNGRSVTSGAQNSWWARIVASTT